MPETAEATLIIGNVLLPSTITLESHVLRGRLSEPGPCPPSVEGTQRCRSSMSARCPRVHGELIVSQYVDELPETSYHHCKVVLSLSPASKWAN